MFSNQDKSLTLEIAHVLFMDIVGYSNLSINHQVQQLQQLNEIVREMEGFQRAQLSNQLLRLPTGDGMALVFFGSLVAPAQCALEISRALINHPEIKLRMGIHSGPVYRIEDINANMNVAGGGINIAQRVMDCGNTGHILLSKRVADDLSQLSSWGEHLHDLGEIEVKHGVRIHLFNLYTSELGNPKLPKKFQPVRKSSKHRGKSLAVLPLVNASADPDNEYLSDGITDSIINSLSQLPKLRVIARSTVFRYKGKEVDPQEVGYDLGVLSVLTGRVLQLKNNLIIKTELVDTVNGIQLWGEQYNRHFSDIFTVQEEVAKEIIEKLRLKLTGEEKKRVTKRHTENVEAYKFYLKGRYFWNKRTPEGTKKAIEYFHQAIDSDPTYALAYTGLADCYSTLSRVGVLPPKEILPKAKAAAIKALELDNTLSEAYISMGYIAFAYDWDWASIEKDLKRAIELNPNYAPAHEWYGLYLAAIGHFDKAIAEIKQAEELDPLSLTVNANAGYIYYWARQYDKAIEQNRKALEIDPNFILARISMAQAYEQTSRYQEAITELQKAKLIADHPWIPPMLARVYAMLGERNEAIKILDELEELSKQRYIPRYFTAAAYAALGEKDRAFEWLEKAYNDLDFWLLLIKVEPRVDSLRSDSRFIDLLRKVGLQP